MNSDMRITTADWLDEGSDDYERLYYYMPSEHVISNLEKSRLKISNFESCNDIFELSHLKMNRDQRMKAKCWLEKVATTLGLICFTRNWRSPVMWGHYAHNGKGCCLVVDVRRKDHQPVAYTGLRKKFSGKFPESENPSEEFKKFCSTKHLNWAYEEEMRLLVRHKDAEVSEESGHYFLKFGEKIKLAGVINGPRPDLGTSEVIAALRKHQDCKFFQCRPAFQRFEMAVQKEKSYWKA